jgi:mannose-1-phosphate guanylyltransferase
MSGHTWAVVLAAGEGSRLRSLTTASDGVAVPKQFCSLNGGASLLGEALRRAESIAAHEHICLVVAQQHKRFWEPLLASTVPANIIVQPENRGTANGILLPLLHILARDPDARIVLLPSDHHVSEEAVLAEYLKKAVLALQRAEDEIILLGMKPDELDPELGYILPGKSHAHGLRSVTAFIEKPSETRARELTLQGALWNVFIVATRATTLLKLFQLATPDIVAAMRAALAVDATSAGQSSAMAELYRTLPSRDFSSDIAQQHESLLRVIAVPSCGWSDLGTPKRVGQALHREPAHSAEMRTPHWAHLNLAIQHALVNSVGATLAR